MIKFTIPGEPRGKGRPKFAKNGHTYTPRETAAYENLVKLEYERQCSGKYDKDAPLSMWIDAFYSIPKSASKKKRQQMLDNKIRPTKKPDMDNIVKVIADSLNGIAYHDDAQIVDTYITKRYSDTPRVEVIICEARADESELWDLH